MKISKFLRKSGVLVGAVIASAGATYYLTSVSYDSRVAELQQQVAELEKAERQAQVTQRVSEQLEDIAKQQTIISNRKKEEAEKARGEAEEQKVYAQKAQAEAQLSARRAEEERLLAEKARNEAEKQKEIAQTNMLQAQQARDKADTLYYQSLANSLAQTSLTQSQNGNTDVSRLLAYASWHFAEQYKGNSENIYMALLHSSDSRVDINNDMKGNVRRLKNIGNYTVGVTDYGELFYADGDKLCFQRPSSKSGKTDSYDMRDLVSLGLSENYVLCSDGKLLSADLTGLSEGNAAANLKLTTLATLTGDIAWHRLLRDNKGMFFAIGDKSLAWVSNGVVVGVKTFDTTITTIGLDDNNRDLHIFLDNGLHYLSESPGVAVVAPIANLKDGERVTAYLDMTFVNDDGTREEYQLLGIYDGRILVADENGKWITTIFAHSSPITDLCTWGELMGSTSYDNTLKLWDVNDLKTMANPVEIRFANWPLCLDADSYSKTGVVWVGTEKGGVTHFCSRLEKNAASTRYKLNREFYPYEWNYYIGNSTPQVNFLEKGGTR